MLNNFLWFEGIPFPSKDFDYETIKDVCNNFVVKDGDIFTVGYPKSGNNWVIEIICLINSKGNPKWSQSVPIWDRSPWLEATYGYELINKMERPLLFSSHLPFHLFPKSLFSSKSKMIYLMRNPRDILVSGFHFWNAFKDTTEITSLEQYFEKFLQGNVPWGSWFEHVRGWLSMGGRENFLVLTYEEMQKDIRSNIQKICQFLGKSLEPEELELVVKNSSFQNMKNNKMTNFSMLHDYSLQSDFLLTRKGVSGDWKTHFTVTQADAFDKVYQEKMLGFPPGLFPWE